MENQYNNHDKFILIKPFKSVAVAILLALIIGPIGLLYATLVGGIIMSIVIFILLAASSVNSAVMPLVWISWLICPFWAVLSSNHYNKKLLAYLSRNKAP